LQQASKKLYISQIFVEAFTLYTKFFMATVEVTGLQVQFLRGIEDVIPPSSSLVSELSDVLEISTDSAYRRMRGETLLTINEIVKLCDHFQISFDAFSKVKSGMVTFTYLPIDVSAESLANYLETVLKELNQLVRVNDSRIVYACKDIPLFYHFNYPELANFMIFFWMRTILNLPDFSKVKYDADFQFPELLGIGKSIFEAYSKIQSAEVWTELTVQSTLKQISFYWESGIFESKEVALRVCAALSKEIEDIERMAEFGTKKLNETIEGSEHNAEDSEVVTANYKLYVSDIELNNNCQLISMGDLHSVSLGHLSFSTMLSSNELYFKKTEQWINNIIKKSTLVSGASEKQRFQFFQSTNKCIDDLMKRIAEG
jgi:hypothetical protein